MSINDIPLQRLKEILASDMPLTIVTTEALIARLEQAEAAVARVWALCMSTDGDYLDNEETVNTVGDILEALDGDTRRCLECDGTGDVEVHFKYGIQAQDCTFCGGSGDTRG